MQVLVNIRHLTDETIDDLWRMHSALLNQQLVEAAANDNEPANEPANEPEAPVDLPSLDDCRAALRRVSEAFGMSGTMAIVDTFGVDKVSEIPAEQRPKLIAACDARLSS